MKQPREGEPLRREAGFSGAGYSEPRFVRGPLKTAREIAEEALQPDYGRKKHGFGWNASVVTGSVLIGFGAAAMLLGIKPEISDAPLVASIPTGLGTVAGITWFGLRRRGAGSEKVTTGKAAAMSIKDRGRRTRVSQPVEGDLLFAAEPAVPAERPGMSADANIGPSPEEVTQSVEATFERVIEAVRKPVSELSEADEVVIEGFFFDVYGVDPANMSDAEALEFMQQAFGTDSPTAQIIVERASEFLFAMGVGDLPAVFGEPAAEVSAPIADSADDPADFADAAADDVDVNDPAAYVRPDGNIDWKAWAKRAPLTLLSAVNRETESPKISARRMGAQALVATLVVAGMATGYLPDFGVVPNVSIHSPVTFDSGAKQDAKPSTPAAVPTSVTPAPEKPALPAQPPRETQPAAAVTSNFSGGFRIEQAMKVVDMVGDGKAGDMAFPVRIEVPLNQAYGTLDWSVATAFKSIGVDVFDPGNPMLNGATRWELTTFVTKSVGMEPTQLNKVYKGDVFNFKVTPEIAQWLIAKNVKVPDNVLRQVGLLTSDIPAVFAPPATEASKTTLTGTLKDNGPRTVAWDAKLQGGYTVAGFKKDGDKLELNAVSANGSAFTFELKDPRLLEELENARKKPDSFWSANDHVEIQKNNGGYSAKYKDSQGTEKVIANNIKTSASVPTGTFDIGAINIDDDNPRILVSPKEGKQINVPLGKEDVSYLKKVRETSSMPRIMLIPTAEENKYTLNYVNSRGERFATPVAAIAAQQAAQNKKDEEDEEGGVSKYLLFIAGILGLAGASTVGARIRSARKRRTATGTTTVV
jgi:hypothetical protein